MTTLYAGQDNYRETDPKEAFSWGSATSIRGGRTAGRTSPLVRTRSPPRFTTFTVTGGFSGINLRVLGAWILDT